MKSLIVGNWKLYINSVTEGKNLLRAIDRNFPRGVKVMVVVCPQVPLAAALRREYSGRRIAFGTQDSFWEGEGAYTGEISPLMLKSSGLEYVIVGHAEKRALGETDETVSKKAAAALSAKLNPVICLGEPERDSEGAHFSFLAKNVAQSLARIGPAHASRVTLAYDPLWAIGEPEAPPSRVVSEGLIFIRKTVAGLWGRDAALRTRIIYGGSVTPESAKALKDEGHAQGLLIGRASVDAEAFTGIIRAFS